MSVSPQPQINESFSGRQRLFKNVWTGVTSSTSGKRAKATKQRKIIRTARIDDDKPPIVLTKYKRKVRAKKMVHACNKILNYCQEHGLAKHILAKRAEEGVYGVRTRIRRRRKIRYRARKSGKRSSSPISLAVIKTEHLQLSDRKVASQPLSPQPSQKRKSRRKKKMVQARKAKLRQNSETVKSWLNIERLKQSMNKDNWPDGKKSMLHTPERTNSASDMETLPREVPKKSQSPKKCTKKGQSSVERLKTTDSLKAIRNKKSHSIKSNSISSKIESIKEVITPADSSSMVRLKEAVTPKLNQSTTKSILKRTEIKRITSSKAVSVNESATESMDSVQKKVTDYVAYLKTINSRTGTDPIDNFKEVMRVVGSRGSIPIAKRVISKRFASNVSVPTYLPKTAIPIKRFASIPTTKDVQQTMSEVTKKTEQRKSAVPSKVAVISAQCMKSPAMLKPTEVRRIIRRVESESYPSSAVSSTPSATCWRSCDGYGGPTSTRSDPYAKRELLPINKISIE